MDKKLVNKEKINISYERGNFEIMFDTGGTAAGLTGLNRPQSERMNKTFQVIKSTVTWQVLHRNGMGPKFDIRMKGVQGRHHYSESSLS